MTAAIRTPREIVANGLLPESRLPELERVASRYAVAITPALAELIDPDDPADPIGLQYLPSGAELDRRPEERGDPIGDDAHAPVDGVVHRYPDRVLLKPVHVCAVYCRFCFRREVVGPGRSEALSPEKLRDALAYIAAHPEIWEVILSGGDPLVMSPRRMAVLMNELAVIPHVKVVRIHTRVPVADPERLTAQLVESMRCAGKAVWVVVHVNHARELTEAARLACARLVDAGLPVLSQSVLLRGVNDEPSALEALMRALVETRVKPYYLHHTDLAPGTSGFRTTIAHGREIVRSLRGHTSGLCQPTYVLDIPGGHGKAPVESMRPDGSKGWVVQDRTGCWHNYRDP